MAIWTNPKIDPKSAANHQKINFSKISPTKSDVKCTKTPPPTNFIFGLEVTLASYGRNTGFWAILGQISLVKSAKICYELISAK